MVIKTFEVEATSKEEAESFLEDYNSALKLDIPRPDQVKLTDYTLGWEEEPNIDSTEGRNKVLAAFLKLMHTIPGLPPQKIPEQKLIILPFDKQK